MPRTQKEDGSWEAMEFGSGNSECGKLKQMAKKSGGKVVRLAK